MLALRSLFYSGINDQDSSAFRLPRPILRFIWSNPRLFARYAKQRYGIDIYKGAYDLVVDGFPRSGNTFCSRMVAVSQDSRLKIFTLHHCAPFLLASLDSHFPVCLTLRRPEDAVVSWVLFRRLPVPVVLKLYIDFHLVLHRYRMQFLVLDFETITADFSVVLRLINRRFNMNLTIPDRFDDLSKNVFSQIDQYYEGKKGGFDPAKVARPHPQREEMKQAVRRELLSPRHAKLLAKGRELYDSFHAEARRELKGLE